MKIVNRTVVAAMVVSCGGRGWSSAGVSAACHHSGHKQCLGNHKRPGTRPSLGSRGSQGRWPVLAVNTPGGGRWGHGGRSFLGAWDTIRAFGGVKLQSDESLLPLGKGAPTLHRQRSPRKTNTDGERFARVSVPGIFVYLPSKEKLKASGGAVIVVATGGAYSHLTRVAGGDGTADEFVPKGIAIVSLKYRMQPPSTNPEADGVLAAKRAIRTMRANAADWGIDPQKIGMMGWSAGGNLIVSLCTHLEKDGAGDPAAADPIERENCKPNFVVLWSPWPNGKAITNYTPAKEVTLPPAMIGGAEDDTTAPFPYVTSVKDLWLKGGGQAEFIVQPTGKHQSFELNIGEAKNWPEKFLPWMEKLGMWKSGQ